MRLAIVRMTGKDIVGPTPVITYSMWSTNKDKIAVFDIAKILSSPRRHASASDKQESHRASPSSQNKSGRQRPISALLQPIPQAAVSSPIKSRLVEWQAELPVVFYAPMPLA